MGDNLTGTDSLTGIGADWSHELEPSAWDDMRAIAMKQGLAAATKLSAAVERRAALRLLSASRSCCSKSKIALAVSGWLAVHLLLRLLARTGLGGFAAYRVVLGFGVLTLLATGVR